MTTLQQYVAEQSATAYPKTSGVGYFSVIRRGFLEAYALARALDQRVEDATSHPRDLPAVGVYSWLSDDHMSGYQVTTSGELIAVFSRVKGRGDDLIDSAIHNGATHLDCFDGYLPTLYSRHGFREFDRDPNWTPGGPDVVYMSLPDLPCKMCGGRH